MKTPILSTLLVLAAMLSTSQAAPEIKASEISDAALEKIATPRQQASMKQYREAINKAKAEREAAMKEAKSITIQNDAGTKKTIINRRLNDSLPACEREAEKPRTPNPYKVRH